MYLGRGFFLNYSLACKKQKENFAAESLTFSVLLRVEKVGMDKLYNLVFFDSFFFLRVNTF